METIILTQDSVDHEIIWMIYRFGYGFKNVYIFVDTNAMECSINRSCKHVILRLNSTTLVGSINMSQSKISKVENRIIAYLKVDFNNFDFDYFYIDNFTNAFIDVIFNTSIHESYLVLDYLQSENRMVTNPLNIGRQCRRSSVCCAKRYDIVFTHDREFINYIKYKFYKNMQLIDGGHHQIMTQSDNHNMIQIYGCYYSTNNKEYIIPLKDYIRFRSNECILTFRWCDIDYDYVEIECEYMALTEDLVVRG